MAVQSTRTVVLSERMLEKLNKTEHFISKYLINLHNSKKASNVKFSYIDMTEQDGTLSLLNSSKEVDFKTGVPLTDSEKWKSKSRTNVRIGSVVRALLKDGNVKFSDVDIENFSNKLRFKEKHKFELVKGNDIKKWYYHGCYLKVSSYSSLSSSLNASCMRYKYCGNYLSAYTKNPDVSLLICTDIETGKLLSRAIVWHKAILNNDREIVFVDRIYTSDDRFLDTVKDYIKSQGWWSKRRQGRENPDIENEKLNEVINKPHIRVKTSITSWGDKKPYMDTMKFLHEEVVDDKITLYLANYEGVYSQVWSCTNGTYHYNTAEQSTIGKMFYLSEHLNVSINDISISKGLFVNKNKNKKYKFYETADILKYIKENVDVLSKVNFISHINFDSYVNENTDIIYNSYKKRIDKYMLVNFGKLNPKLAKIYRYSSILNSISFGLKTLKEIYKTDDIKVIFDKVKKYINVSSIISNKKFYLEITKTMKVEIVKGNSSRRYLLKEVVEPKSVKKIEDKSKKTKAIKKPAKKAVKA